MFITLGYCSCELSIQTVATSWDILWPDLWWSGFPFLLPVRVAKPRHLSQYFYHLTMVTLAKYSDCCLWNILWANVESTHSTGHQLMIRFGVFRARVEDPGLVHLNSGTSTPRRPLLDQRRGRSKRLIEVRVTWGTLRAHNLVVPIRWTPRLAIPCAHCSHSDFLESLCSSNWGWSGLVTHFLPG